MTDCTEERSFAQLVNEVTTLLITTYDFSLEDAEEAINKSVESTPDAWNENADSATLAKYLASGDDDD